MADDHSPDLGLVPEVPMIGDVDLQREIEQFLFHEARTLDDRRWDDWIKLLAEDIHYWMPGRYNRLLREVDEEVFDRQGTSHFDDDLRSMRTRVARLNTGMAWAENPPSRTRHLVSNVIILSSSDGGAKGIQEFEVQSSFLVYRNRATDVVDIWVGRREDVLRRVASRRWQIARRRIELDQGTILSKNLSVFF